MTREPEQQEVARAAAAIVDAYQATDAERYFPCFADDATFCFHTEPARLDNRREYEQLWAGWIASGWRVRSCDSLARLIQTFPGGAVFTHDVATTIETPEGPESFRERETIVFRVVEDGLLAVHEHLSPIG